MVYIKIYGDFPQPWQRQQIFHPVLLVNLQFDSITDSSLNLLKPTSSVTRQQV